MISAFFPIFFTMVMVIDPLGLVPTYISLTSHVSPRRRREILRKAILIAFGILVFFVFLGKRILMLLHIKPESFFVAGGIMLFIISLEMLFGRTTLSKISAREKTQKPLFSDLEESGSKDEGVSLAVFPLAIPMLAGPGSITTIILFTGSGEAGTITNIILLISSALALSLAWISLLASEWVLKFLGQTGVSVLERIMGLLLSGLSVQFVYDGISRLGILG
jgi:multiple antibiotic resistance protein